MSGNFAGIYLGLVVPKRYAKRSVMRSLIKRKTRAVFEKSAGRFPRGMWVVRLARPFPKAAFTSAQSSALRTHLQLELESLVNNCPGLT